MWLIGKINFENALKDDEGMNGVQKLHFVLPSRLRRRHKVKVRYFGFHSGVSADNLDITQITIPEDRIFRSRHTDNTRQSPYQHRHFPSELRMSAKADGASIMHDNVGVKMVGKNGHMSGIEYVRYPTTKVSNATLHNGNYTLEHDWNRPMPHGYGASEMQDMTLGTIDETVSNLEVCIEAFGYEVKNNPNFSNESNVRMDTVTVVLQLV